MAIATKSDTRRTTYPRLLAKYLKVAQSLPGFKTVPVTIRYTQHPSSRGRTSLLWAGYPTAVVVTLGMEQQDAESVILHELAHCFANSEAGHGENFYRNLFTLGRAAKFSMSYLLKREQGYKVRMATRIGREMGIRGASASSRGKSWYTTTRKV